MPFETNIQEQFLGKAGEEAMRGKVDGGDGGWVHILNNLEGINQSTQQRLQEAGYQAALEAYGEDPFASQSLRHKWNTQLLSSSSHSGNSSPMVVFKKGPLGKGLEISSGQFSISAVEFLTLDSVRVVLVLTEAVMNMGITHSSVPKNPPNFQWTTLEVKALNMLCNILSPNNEIPN